MEDDEFFTDNLWLAAFLEQSRVERLGFVRSDRGRVTFRYSGRDTCEQLRAQYELSEVTLSLPEFQAKVSRLMDLIFGGKRRSNPTMMPPPAVYVSSQTPVYLDDGASLGS